MKHVFHIVLLFLVVTTAFIGCAKKPIMLSTDCPNSTKSLLISQLVSVLMSEGFEVKVLNETAGLLLAETAPDYSVWTGLNTINKWSFTIRDDSRVQAYANSYSSSQNVFGSTTGTALTPYDDRIHADHTWYWSVRNKLEQVCGGNIVFIETGKQGQ